MIRCGASSHACAAHRHTSAVLGATGEGLPVYSAAVSSLVRVVDPGQEYRIEGVQVRLQIRIHLPAGVEHGGAAMHSLAL